MIRWNSRRPRAFVSVAGPLGGDPRWKYEVAFDGRRDDELAYRRDEVAAKMTSISTGRFEWSSGFAFSRDYRLSDVERTTPSFPRKRIFSIKYVGGIRKELLRISESRFEINASVGLDAGKLFSDSPSRFGKLAGEIAVKWHDVSGRVYSGKMIGAVPSYELFVLGLDRDSELWLRATRERIATRQFALANLDLLKTIQDGSIFKLHAGPFLDVARTSQWLADSGLQLKVTALGAISATFSFGKNLGNGENVWFVNTSR